MATLNGHIFALKFFLGSLYHCAGIIAGRMAYLEALTDGYDHSNAVVVAHNAQTIASNRDPAAFGPADADAEEVIPAGWCDVFVAYVFEAVTEEETGSGLGTPTPFSQHKKNNKKMRQQKDARQPTTKLEQRGGYPETVLKLAAGHIEGVMGTKSHWGPATDAATLGTLEQMGDSTSALLSGAMSAALKLGDFYPKERRKLCKLHARLGELPAIDHFAKRGDSDVAAHRCRWNDAADRSTLPRASFSPGLQPPAVVGKDMLRAFHAAFEACLFDPAAHILVYEGSIRIQMHGIPLDLIDEMPITKKMSEAGLAPLSPPPDATSAAEQGKSCLNCGRKSSKAKPNAKLSICSRCRSAWFCSTDCQKASWKEHKLNCRKPDPAGAGATAATKPASASNNGSEEDEAAHRQRLGDLERFITGGYGEGPTEGSFASQLASVVD